MSVADSPAAPPTTTFARRHAWLAVLVVGTALFIAEERTLVATQNPNLVPSAILLGASIVPLAFLTMVVVSLLTPGRMPVHVTTTMVRLHTPEAVRLDRGVALRRDGA